MRRLIADRSEHAPVALAEDHGVAFDQPRPCVRATRGDGDALALPLAQHRDPRQRSQRFADQHAPRIEIERDGDAFERIGEWGLLAGAQIDPAPLLPCVAPRKQCVIVDEQSLRSDRDGDATRRDGIEIEQEHQAHADHRDPRLAHARRDPEVRDGCGQRDREAELVTGQVQFAVGARNDHHVIAGLGEAVRELANSGEAREHVRAVRENVTVRDVEVELVAAEREIEDPRVHVARGLDLRPLQRRAYGGNEQLPVLEDRDLAVIGDRKAQDLPRARAELLAGCIDDDHALLVDEGEPRTIRCDRLIGDRVSIPQGALGARARVVEQGMFLLVDEDQVRARAIGDRVRDRRQRGRCDLVRRRVENLRRLAVGIGEHLVAGEPHRTRQALERPRHDQAPAIEIPDPQHQRGAIVRELEQQLSVGAEIRDDRRLVCRMNREPRAPHHRRLRDPLRLLDLRRLRIELLERGERLRGIRLHLRARLRDDQRVVALCEAIARCLRRALVELGCLARSARLVALREHAADADPRERGEHDHRSGADRERGPVALREPTDLLTRRVPVRRDELTGEESPHVLAERTRVRVPGLGVERQRLVDDRDQLHRCSGRSLGER